MATLYIVGTPIGNLEDISMRALRILGEVDFILCEDTRVTRTLLEHYQIKTPTISYHQHSGESKEAEIINLLAGGKNLALVSDAGTPGISDPGGKLIQAALEKLGGETGANGYSPVKIESVPGPSAVTAALSISGIPTDKFVFLGFPPHKKGRQTFLKKIVASEWPVVVYESKHRILKLLNELRELTDKTANDEIKNYLPTCLPDRQAGQAGELRITNKKQNQSNPLTSVVVCRELSKMHETVYRGSLESIMEKIQSDKNDQKGEFVVIVGK
ncbi:MAG: 16S rRNA (cytidine(1402)-2'-O)-methyltransferase [Patescibacteria group bacterium]|nr:16S rRNA (cytidine(1402)-2'-O)-methyltransferase [Patescibacteria group bacterium]